MPEIHKDVVQPADRPLSPHLQVYRLPLNAWMSISHRITGFGLCVGTAMLTWMLVAAATGADSYETFLAFAGSLVGRVLLFCWSLALFYHLASGVRHLVWDTGLLFNLKNANRAGYVVLAFTFIAMLLFWWKAGGL